MSYHDREDSTTPRKGDLTNRSKSSMAKKRGIAGSRDNSSLVSSSQVFANRKNSTDGFKTSSDALKFKKTTANTKNDMMSASKATG